MKLSTALSGQPRFVAAVIFCGLLLLPSMTAFGQEAADKSSATAPAATPASDPAATAEKPASDATAPKSDASADSATKEDTAAPATPEKPVDTPANEKSKSADQGGTVLTATDAAEKGAAVAAGTIPPAAPAGGMSPWLIGLIVVATFVLPILAGNFIAQQVRMPDYGWKISLVLLSILASSVIIYFGQFKFGPDLAGGITLIYELADSTQVLSDSTNEKGQDQQAEQPDGAQGRKVDMPQLISALKQRIDPTSTQEITIRGQGESLIEIIIPKTGQDSLDLVKRRITELGKLEFRITADSRQPKDQNFIKQALLMPPNQKLLIENGEVVAEWVAYDPREFGAPDHEDHRVVKRMAGDTPEALVLIDSMNVTGDYLTSATKGMDQRGGPSVNFSFNHEGAARFGQLTSQNKPNQATGAERFLGIILDKKLISAPGIRETIRDQGQISGGAMGNDEVDFIISILNAGSLPVALNKMPISEEIISPTLGAVTIQKGTFAIGVSLAAVVLFMLFYYRLAGLIAVFALIINLLILLAVMILIKAAFTLPGLAGVVLTIGMAVDANVLIFERLRDELKNGAALRMAIRNGFDRAMGTIVDSNVTTIIAGIVMYAVGRDQIKGFAVTLILGILISMFTAIFCSRIVFDILERRGWIKTLKMHSVIGETHFDFMSWRRLAIGASWAAIAIGLFAAYMRGAQLFNIDFTGGSSVTFVLNKTDAKPITAVQEALDKTELVDRNLLVVRNGETDTRYTVSTNEQSVETVKNIVVKTFGEGLMNYSLDIRDLAAFTEGGVSGTQATLLVNDANGSEQEDGVSHDAIVEWIRNSLTKANQTGVVVSATNPNYRTGSAARFTEWQVRLAGLDESAAKNLLDGLKTEMESTPVFPLANNIGGRVSTNLQRQALISIALSCLGIIIYLWVRFEKVSYGLAAVIALLHDVLFTVGAVALSYYVVKAVPGLAAALKIDSFQISLDIVAALLTIIGYSVNDTIIIFDRLREVKGKSPNLTPAMINEAVNKTLSRTILTAFTVFLVVIILYALGGEGIHGFAYCMVVGVFVGAYSSIYIAAPVLYWLSGSPAAGTASGSVITGDRPGRRELSKA